MNLPSSSHRRNFSSPFPTRPKSYHRGSAYTVPDNSVSMQAGPSRGEEEEEACDPKACSLQQGLQHCPVLLPQEISPPPPTEHTELWDQLP